MSMRWHGIVVFVVLLGAWVLAEADVPKAEDIAACNKEAHEAVRVGSASPMTASPNTKDTSRAREAQRGDTITAPADSTSRSDDPQLEGMDPQGAKNPLYQAAYRTCMRKNSF